jgi:hypothetical protein
MTTTWWRNPGLFLTIAILTTYSAVTASPHGGEDAAGSIPPVTNAGGVQTCPAGSTVRGIDWGTFNIWACDVDDVGVTSVAAGTGLTGGGAGGSITLGLAPGGVGAGELAAGAVTGGAIAGGAVTTSAIANNAVTMAKLDAPIGYASVSPGSIVNATGELISVGSFTATSNGSCVVTVVSNTGEAAPSGWAAVTGGYRIGAGTPVLGPIGAMFTSVPGQTLHTATGTFGFAVTSGTTYSVGCGFGFSSGASSFAGNTYSCAASWVCT